MDDAADGGREDRRPAQGPEHFDPLEILGGWHWNQAVTNADTDLHRVLITIIANDKGHGFKPVGTGFIVLIAGQQAIALSAAHVFYEAVAAAHSGPPKHHASTPPMFLPPYERVDLDRRKLFTSHRHEDKVWNCDIEWLIWDKKADIAFFCIRRQNSQDEPFDTFLPFDNDPISVGDIITVGGYKFSSVDADIQSFGFGSELVLRAGVVTNIFKDGYLSESPCLQTSIPFFSGMSGGPAMRYSGPNSSMKVFGLITSSPMITEADSLDRSCMGEGKISLLPVKLLETSNEVNTFDFSFFCSGKGADAKPY